MYWEKIKNNWKPLLAIVAVLALAFWFFGKDWQSRKLAYDMSESVSGQGMAYPEMAYDMKASSRNMVSSDAMYAPGVAEIMPVGSDSINATERKLEKTISLNGSVSDKTKFVTKLQELTDYYKAYWQSFYDNNYQYSPSLSFTIKVPSAQLDHFLKDLRPTLDFIDSENLNVSDVSLEYYDLQARLESARKEEAQYQAVLEKAYKVEDILKVTEYLNNVRSRIESMTAQLEVLSNRTDYATLYLNVRILNQGASVNPEKEWSLGQTWKEAVNDLIENSKIGLENIVYWLVTNVITIAFWTVVAIVLLVIYRVRRKK
jgi:hypothetical protein